MKKVIVSVTNDLAGDQRVHRVCLTLKGMGFAVLLVGRRFPNSPVLKARDYATRRIRLIFNKGPLFYAEYNFRLFLFLLFSRCDLLLSNDLDTLPANRLAAFFRRKPLVYDSHELFTGVPELIGRPGTRRIWEWLEKKLIPKVDQAYTVSESIASHYAEKYNVPFAVIRNLPMAASPLTQSSGKNDVSQPSIIYQGALNRGRGLEAAIRAMAFLPEVSLIIAGSGDLENELKSLTSDLKLTNVKFTGRIPFEDLHALTSSAQLGISVEEDLGLSYRYALPNKLFDYIQARIPMVVSDLPEMSAVVNQYDIGLIAASLKPEMLAGTFRKALTDTDLRKKWAANLELASAEFTWEKEEAGIRKIFQRYL